MHMRPGMTVAVRHGQMGKTFSAKVGEVLPLFDPAARTLKVRIDVDNPRYDLRPDMFVDVEIPITMPPSMSVPADAVLDTGTKTIVYVDKGNGIFEPRRVKTGWSLGGQVEITDGLTPGEKIVVSGNFLIDSESRMEISASGAAGRDQRRPCSERAGPGGADGREEKRSRHRAGDGPSWAEMLEPPGGKRGGRDGAQNRSRRRRPGPASPRPRPGSSTGTDRTRRERRPGTGAGGANSPAPITSASSASPRTALRRRRARPGPPAKQTREKNRTSPLSPRPMTIAPGRTPQCRIGRPPGSRTRLPDMRTRPPSDAR